MDEFNYLGYIDESAFEEMREGSTEYRMDFHATLESEHPQQNLFSTALDNFQCALENDGTAPTSGSETRLIALPVTSQKTLS